jgi:hypothetical protein
VSDRHDDRHWRDVANGPLNPRILELRSTLHPGERIAALSIPIVVSTPFPFTICIKTWVKDGTPSEEHLILQKGGLLGNELLPFSRGSIDIHVGLHPEPASRHLEYPTETGETLLTLMAKHPQPEEFGITHILSGDPSDPEKALFLPSLARAGQPWGMSKQMFQEELNALIRLGWLEAGSTTTNQACYRLSMPGRADARFNALVELAVSEQQR